MKSTNLYAEKKIDEEYSQRHDQEACQRKRRKWKPVTVPEIKQFFAVSIVIGVYKYTSPLDLWRNNGRKKLPGTFGSTGTDPIRHQLSLVRYQQIKRYFHIYEPQNTALPIEDWFKKIEPLNSNIRRRSKELCIPGPILTADEMMVRYFGRSRHTAKMPKKPIKKGYKVILNPFLSIIVLSYILPLVLDLS